MLAKEIKTVEEAYKLLSNHSVEIKFDGQRVFIYLGKKYKIVNREGNDITHIFPDLEPLRKIKMNAIVDAEIICLNHMGKPDFQALQKRIHLQNPLDIELRSKLYPARAIVFDLVAYGEKEEIVKTKLMVRRLQMEALLFPWVLLIPETSKIMSISPKFEFDTAEAFQYFWDSVVIKGNLEGLMLKNINSTYEFGNRSRSWLKLKNHSSVDLKIDSWEETTGKKGNVGMVVYATYKGNKIKVAVGGHEDRKMIKRGTATVIEIEYLGETDSGKLRQPTTKCVK
jgi:bifunctional non-homologous end joining protein LigD